MKFKTLPGTKMKVSEVCLGTMTWGEQNSEAEAHAQLDYAIGQGVNFIDTAEMYPVPPNAKTQGRTEKYLGTCWRSSGAKDFTSPPRSRGPAGVTGSAAGAPI